MSINRRAFLTGGLSAAAVGASLPVLAVPLPRQGLNPTQAKAYRRLSQVDLDQTVALHVGWLEDQTTGRFADLSNTDLSGLTLSRVSLEGADLTGANLTETVFDEVDLSWARFVGSDLSCATLDFCCLAGTNFSKARLNQSRIVNQRPGDHGTDQAKSFDNVSFRHANLTCARIFGHLEEVNLSGANLIAADLSGSSFDQCEFVGADLTAANLNNSEIVGSNLSSAVLRYSKLGGATLYMNDLSGADLTGACMAGAFISGNYLTGAQIRNADLRCAKIDNYDSVGLIRSLSESEELGCQLDGAIINGRTFPWPGGQMPNRVWAET